MIGKRRLLITVASIALVTSAGRIAGAQTARTGADTAKNPCSGTKGTGSTTARTDTVFVPAGDTRKAKKVALGKAAVKDKDAKIFKTTSATAEATGGGGSNCTNPIGEKPKPDANPLDNPASRSKGDPRGR